MLKGYSITDIWAQLLDSSSEILFLNAKNVVFVKILVFWFANRQY